MPVDLPHSSVDRLHAAAVEACLAYERACKRRGLKLKKVTITYEPAGEGFDLKTEEKPYPKRDGKTLIPIEERLVPGEDEPLPEEKEDKD